MEKKKNTRKTYMVIRMICEGALMVALAQVLGYLKLWRMPWGGSVSLIMVPIIFFALRWGLAHGLVAGLALGILQFMFDGGFVLGWQCILGDYVLPYAMVGFAGVFAGKKSGIYLGSLLGGIARFIPHYITGATLWAEYMPEVFFGMTMTTPWFYSLLYNAVYVGLNTILCMVIFGLLSRSSAKKYLTGEDLR